jgi:hypothetical protein
VLINTDIPCGPALEFISPKFHRVSMGFPNRLQACRVRALRHPANHGRFGAGIRYASACPAGLIASSFRPTCLERQAHGEDAIQ